MDKKDRLSKKIYDIFFINNIQEINDNCSNKAGYSTDIDQLKTHIYNYNDKIRVVINLEVIKFKDMNPHIDEDIQKVDSKIDKYQKNEGGPYDFDKESPSKDTRDISIFIPDSQYLTKVYKSIQANNIDIITKFCGYVNYIENLFNLLFEINKLIIRVLLLKYGKIITVNKKIETIKNDCIIQETRIAKLQVQIAELNSKLKGNEANKNQLEITIQELRLQITQLQGQLSKLQQNKDKKDTENENIIARLKDDIATLNVKLAYIQKEYNTVVKSREEYYTLYTKLKANETKQQAIITELERKLASSNNYIDRAIKSTSDIIHRISSLVDINELSSPNQSVRRSSAPSVLPVSPARQSSLQNVQQQQPTASPRQPQQPAVFTNNKRVKFNLIELNGKTEVSENDKTQLINIINNSYMSMSENASTYSYDYINWSVLINILYRLYISKYPILIRRDEFAVYITNVLMNNNVRNTLLKITYDNSTNKWVCYFTYNKDMTGGEKVINFDDIPNNTQESIVIKEAYRIIINNLIEYLKPSRKGSNKYLKYKNKYLQLKKLHNL
jgi:hypothetical protein